MRRSKTQSLAEVLGDYISEMHMGRKLKEVSILDSWEQVVGKAIASRTTATWTRDGRLCIHARSSVVRSELMMLRDTLRSRLNELAGEEIIREIIIK